MHSFRYKRQRVEALVNHDIERMIVKSLGEAAHQTVRSYIEAHPTAHNSLIGRLSGNRDAHDVFISALKRLRQEDFEQASLSASLVGEGIARTTRSLLAAERAIPSNPAQGAESKHKMQESLARTEADELNHATTSYVVQVVQHHLKSEVEIPNSFIDWLNGTEEGSEGGLLAAFQRCIALYLKTDQKVHAALVHAMLQDIADSQQAVAESQCKLERICESIWNGQQELPAAFQRFLAAIETDRQAGDATIARLLFAAARPPLKEPFIAGAPPAGEWGLDALRSPARSTPLIGRDDALDALERFLAAPEKLLWAVVSGEAGTGKTRLAGELIAATRGTAPGGEPLFPGGWRAGLYSGGDDWLKVDGLKWTPETDTLIVVDYASKYAAELATLLDHLKSRADGEKDWTSRARFLLLDRIAPDSDHGLAKQMTRGTDAAPRVNLTRWRTDAETLHLRPVDSRFALQIAESYAGERWTGEHRQRLLEEIGHDGELARPLFAALMGHAIGIDRLSPGQLNPVSVAKIALDHQFSPKYWSQGPQVNRAKDVFALVTAGGGVAREALERPEFLSVACGKPLEEGECTEIWDVFVAHCPCDHEQAFPLTPDFLGELFVLGRLFERRGFAPPRAKAWMDEAWQSGREPAEFVVHLAADFAGRTAQLASAFAETGAFEARAKEVLKILFRTTLRPDASEAFAVPTCAFIAFYCAQAGAFDIGDEFVGELENAGVARASIAATWFAYGLNGYLDQIDGMRAARALDKIRTLQSENPDDAVVREWLASGLVNSATFGRRDGNSEDTEKLLDELRDLKKAYSADTAVREILAMALFNIANELSGRGELVVAGKLVDELRQLQCDCPEATVRGWLATALFNLANGLAKNGELEGAGTPVDEIRSLRDAYPDDSAVREKLAMALVNRRNLLAQRGDPKGAGTLVDELRELQQRFPADAAVRERLAMMLFTLVSDLAATEGLQIAGTWLDELRGLRSAFPDDAAVSEHLAQALVNRMILNPAVGDRHLGRNWA